MTAREARSAVRREVRYVRLLPVDGGRWRKMTRREAALGWALFGGTGALALVLDALLGAL